MLGALGQAVADTAEGTLATSGVEWRQYMTYCPCMGRFGNQAEQMLGAMALAKGTNRSLLVPPFNLLDKEYQRYSDLFDIKAIQKYLPGSMDLRDFLDQYGEHHWPPIERGILCYKAAMERSKYKKSCPYQHGEPFTSFWAKHNITFPRSIAIDNKAYISYHPDFYDAWSSHFRDEKVLAFSGNPGAFPSLEQHQDIAQFVTFNKDIKTRLRKYQAEHLEHNRYIAIHARVGSDMKRACESHFDSLKNVSDEVERRRKPYYMGSQQCTGYQAYKFRYFTPRVCLPSDQTIAEDVGKVLDNNPDIKYVFVATDLTGVNRRRFIAKLTLKVEAKRVELRYLEEPDSMMDIAIMTGSDIFIGSCTSTFSAFVTRYRRYVRDERLEYPSAHFGMVPNIKRKERLRHNPHQTGFDEL